MIEGYVVFVVGNGDIMLFDGLFLLVDMFGAFDMFLEVLCLPFPLFDPLALDRGVVQEFGSRAFLR